MRARKAAGVEVKQLANIGENEYRRIMEKSMKHYGAMNKIGTAEIAAAVRDAKSEWRHIQRQAKKAAKPVSKRPAKKAAKRKAPRRK
jgi:predicted regulator of Ras-like GTPase activity (Roadblock/LC7/MglB family)